MSKSLKKLVGMSLATTVAVIAFAPSVSADENYTIQRGDTLSSISSAFKVDIQNIRQANNLTGNLIFAGRKLIIPTDLKVETKAKADSYYTIARGDTLNKIAAKFGTTAQNIRNLNNIKGDLIVAGTKIRVSGSVQTAQPKPAAKPANANTAKAAAKATSYTVKAGDTLAKIAAAQGVSVSQIRSLNNISSDLIFPGQKLALAAAEGTIVKEAPVVAAKPVVDAAPAASAATLNANGQYTVKAGDWLTKIANNFGTTVANLRALNNISGDFIYVGQVLQVTGTPKPKASVAAPTPAPVVEAAPVSRGASILATAEAYIGTPYVWGGRTPAGFDCSGFVQYVYQQARGVNVGTWTVPQESAGPQISVSAAQPGDLLFWGSKGSTYHVAIYAGNNKFIHAPQPGQSVTYASISPYWAPSFAVSMAAYN